MGKSTSSEDERNKKEFGEARDKDGDSEYQGFSDVNSEFSRDDKTDEKVDIGQVQGIGMEASTEEGERKGDNASEIGGDSGGSRTGEAEGIDKYIPSDLQNRKPEQNARGDDSRGFDNGIREGNTNVSREYQATSSPGNSLTEDSGFGSGLPDTAGSGPQGYNKEYSESFNRLVGMIKSRSQRGPELSPQQVIELFRKLPLELRINEAIKTIKEFDQLQNKVKYAYNTIATKSEVYQEAVRRKKPFDRVVDFIFNYFDQYSKMGVKPTEIDKEQFRKVLEQALEENSE